MAPQKSVFTLTEIVLLSIVWSSTSFVWSDVIKTGLKFAFGKLGLGKYATDVLVAIFLLTVVFAMVFLFVNVNIGKSSVFMLTDDEPGIAIPFGRKADPADPAEDSGGFAPPAADVEEFMPMEGLALLP